MDDCPFCRIVAGEADALVLDETETTLAFAPLDPVSEGHLLVVPKAHHASLFDVPPDVLAAVIDHVRDVAVRLEAGGFDGVNLLHDSGGAAQQSVDHLHVHLAPRREGDGLDLWPDSDYDGGRDAESYAAVLEALS